MNKFWLEEKLKECESIKLKIENFLKSLNMSEKDYNKVMDMIESPYSSTSSIIPFLDITYMMYCGDNENEDFDKDYKDYEELVKNSELEKMIFKYKEKDYLKSYLDSEPMKFDGDILITDPCYIIRNKYHGIKPITKNDWGACNYGFNMEKLGINHYMTRDVIYGDWDCTIFNLDTKKEIGKFCADAGLVSVFLLDEVLKYNPDYDYLKNFYSATVIKNFNGNVQFIVKYQDGYYEDETEYHKKGDHWEEYYLEIIGHGVNKVTGEAINFVSKQIGL